MSQKVSPLVSSAVSWMYGHKTLLYQGYSGEDPTFSKAKAIFIQDMRKREFANETEESLMQAFEDALNMV
jgi:hypothetical protein